MTPFPQLDRGGIAYEVTLWSDLLGGVPLLIGVPARPDLNEQAIEEEVAAMAQVLSVRLQAGITRITRYESTSAELQLAQPETP
ncbi:hypothetical protein [Streptomyces filamentosus]|uniref:hypothetical protein n=1 Tax=Streptomyces filamentosus TaxID=67294 RepID=UPI00123BB492|nr:hypothetical protein [Streptomyces filamentosus]KAA6216380.1 hypothetical protein CP979_05050 [Streptomyces filamentosus]